MLEGIKSIEQLNLKGKTVLVRFDLNVPLDDKGVIIGDKRIKAILPTLSYLLAQNAKVVAMSHLGRPKGIDPKQTLAPVAKRLEELIQHKVIYTKEVYGDNVSKTIADASNGDIILLENLRFHDGEYKNELGFAQKLAELGEVYVNDAFATCHREEASMDMLPRLMQDKGIGYLVKAEMDSWIKVLEKPIRPFWVVLGGSKVSTKIELLENLINRVDGMILGGGLALTFMAAKGMSLGRSLVELDHLETAKKVMAKLEAQHKSLVLPIDGVLGRKVDDTQPCGTWDGDMVPLDLAVFDVGPKSVQLYHDTLMKAGTVVFNGPVGVYENEIFAYGTKNLCGILENISEKGVFTVVAGGDAEAAYKKFGQKKNISFISTGGGASLMLLEGKPLPALEALKGNKK